MRTTLFTSCNRAYEPFAVPHIVSALYHNDDMAVEICVEQPERFIYDNKDALAIVDRHFPDRVLIRAGNFKGMAPNSVRILEEPYLRSEYTYITDIDILFLERNITDIHCAIMEKINLPYSNILRPQMQRLTGLHFTSTAAHYPLVIPENLDLKTNDERILYHLVVSKGLPLPGPDATFRPIHGYHFSLNRAPISMRGNLHWNLRPKFLEPYRELIASPLWQEIAPHLGLGYRVALLTLEAALQTQNQEIDLFQPGQLKEVFRQASSVAAAVPAPDADAAQPDMPHPDAALRSTLIKERRFAEAIEVQRRMLQRSPLDPMQHHQMAWLQTAMRDREAALAHELIACTLAPDDGRFADTAAKYRAAWKREMAAESATATAATDASPPR